MMKGRSIILNGYIITGILIAALFLGACASEATVVKRDPTIRLRMPAGMVLDPSISTADEKVYTDSVHHTIMAITANRSAFASVDNYLSCSWKDLDVKLRGLSEDSTFNLISCEKEKMATILTYSVSPSERYYPFCILYFVHKDSYDVQISVYFKTAVTDGDRKYADDIMRTLKVRR